MLFPWIPILALILDSTLASPAKRSCPNVQIRKEWRQLSDNQKANWLSAVKVCIYIFFTFATTPRSHNPWLQCLSHKPRSGTFVPSHSPPDIVAYNTSGSLYDDFVFLHMEQNHWVCASRLVGASVARLSSASIDSFNGILPSVASVVRLSIH
jgi:tyrosinase